MMECVQAVEECSIVCVGLVMKDRHVLVVSSTHYNNSMIDSRIIFTVTGINTPHFNGDSYISYPSINDSFGTIKLYLELRPNSSDGLILYNGQISGTDYISLSLSSNFVQFQYDLGSGPVVIESRHMFDLNDWHTIEARRSGRSGVLIVIRIVSRGRSPGTDHLLQLGEP